MLFDAAIIFSPMRRHADFRFDAPRAAAQRRAVVFDAPRPCRRWPPCRCRHYYALIITLPIILPRHAADADAAIAFHTLTLLCFRHCCQPPLSPFLMPMLLSFSPCHYCCHASYAAACLLILIRQRFALPLIFARHAAAESMPPAMILR